MSPLAQAASNALQQDAQNYMYVRSTRGQLKRAISVHVSRLDARKSAETFNIGLVAHKGKLASEDVWHQLDAQAKYLPQFQDLIVKIHDRMNGRVTFVLDVDNEATGENRLVLLAKPDDPNKAEDLDDILYEAYKAHEKALKGMIPSPQLFVVS